MFFLFDYHIYIYIYIYVIHEKFLWFKIFFNFNNFSCLTFWAQNASIPLDQNMLQEGGAKCFNTPKLYYTDIASSFHSAKFLHVMINSCEKPNISHVTYHRLEISWKEITSSQLWEKVRISIFQFYLTGWTLLHFPMLREIDWKSHAFHFPCNKAYHGKSVLLHFPMLWDIDGKLHAFSMWWSIL